MTMLKEEQLNSTIDHRSKHYASSTSMVLFFNCSNLFPVRTDLLIANWFITFTNFLFFYRKSPAYFSLPFKYITKIIELIYLVFLFWKVFIGSLKSFFSYHKVSKLEQRTSIVLSWDGKRFDLNFKEFKAGLDQATVKDLKQKCKKVTEIPIASMKLRVSGGKVNIFCLFRCSHLVSTFFFFFSQHQRWHCNFN